MSASTPSLQQMPTTWDAVAPTYAEDAAHWTDYVEEALRVVPIAPSQRVLDIACGPGTLSFLAAKQAARVDAIDFSPGMVAQVRERASREGVKNIEATVMDAQSLAFDDAAFDAAFCMFGFFFFPDRAKAFREMHRVVRPGGRALISTWSPIEKRPFMRIAFEAVAEAVPQFPTPTKGDLQDPAECVREMTEAGFRDVEARTFTASVHVDSAEQYVDIVVRSAAPFAVMKKKLPEDAWKATMQKIVEAVRKRLPGSADLSAEAILTAGTRAV